MGMPKFLQGLSVLFTVCTIRSLEVVPVEPGTVQGTCTVPLRHKLPLAGTACTYARKLRKTSGSAVVLPVGYM